MTSVANSNISISISTIVNNAKTALTMARQPSDGPLTTWALAATAWHVTCIPSITHVSIIGHHLRSTTHVSMRPNPSITCISWVSNNAKFDSGLS